MIFKLRPLLFSTVLSLVAFCFPASLEAQFIGYTSPQTVTQTLFNNTNCTGVAQTAVVTNLGQTQHTLTSAQIAGVNNFQAYLEGSNDGVNFTRFSDEIDSNTFNQSIVSAAGYFAVVRAKVTCNPSSTGFFTLQYSGTSVTPGTPAGFALGAQIDKLLANGASDGTSYSTPNIIPPFGNSLGTLYWFGIGAPPAGSTLKYACNNNNGGTLTTVTLPLLIQTGTQVFPISAYSCATLSVIYTSGGASASVYAIDYLFLGPGLPATTDPCQSAGIGKSSLNFLAAAATTTQIIPGSGSTTTYVCGYQFTMAVLAGTVQLTTGTGGACGANTVVKSGVMQTIIGQPFTFGPGASVFTAAPGSGVCMTTTGAGATAAGIINFVQQ